MYNTTEDGQPIELMGKTGSRYTGKIYSSNDSASALSGAAIAVLTNSSPTEDGWEHQVNSIYNTQKVNEELARFSERDDISHLILLPYSENNNEVPDKVDDLIRNYLHG